ncbi:hypothetical protein [Photobacterium nomapromontoriensis]|uniref:hypothetical protein n=1 Tax=Photobacterium nomapromontoriensis TaxID=2910237 RepID=UPI003D13D8C5
MMYKFADNTNTIVALYRGGEVEFMGTAEVPQGVTIHPSWSEVDEADYQRQNKCNEERDWRDMEMRGVLRSLDQLRNDREFGSLSYKGSATMEQLNQYRVLLCDYPSQAGFPYSKRPTMEDVL